jgi:hypothetical protein
MSARCRPTSARSGTLENVALAYSSFLRVDVGTAIDELLLIWLASEASDWENRLEWLPL